MNKPKLKFSKWIALENLENYPYKKFPGVYVISLSNRDLENKEFSWEDDIVYIGMTHSKKGLKDRWGFFEKAIHGRSKDHSGGLRMFKELGTYDGWAKKLYISACHVECNVNKEERTPEDLINMGWVAFMEFEALAEFKKIFNKEPLYNKK